MISVNKTFLNPLLNSLFVPSLVFISCFLLIAFICVFAREHQERSLL